MSKNEDKSFNLISYLLSRIAFVGTHLVFVYWLLFMSNDPLQLGTNTLDFPADKIKPPGVCTKFILDNALYDLVLFSLWWGTHSLFARKFYKQAIGLWKHPLERPIFATVAWIVWAINVVNWKPITDCERWDIFTTSPLNLGLSFAIFAFGSFLVVGMLWLLPQHVFGTDHYKYKQGKFPEGGIIRRFPYGLVRHPAAAGFLFMYWSFPARTLNHWFLAALWTLFIVIGTLVFEEGGLRGEDEFGKKYVAYKNEVNAFFPKPSSFFALTGEAKKKE